jgi:tetratricopeptide (TPR) repeat protein
VVHLDRANAIIGEHPYLSKRFVAWVLNDLGAAQLALGQRERARDLFERALAAAREVYTGDHPHLAPILANLADVLNKRGDTARAERLAREAVAMCKRLSPDGQDDPYALNMLRLRADQPQRDGRG